MTEEEKGQLQEPEVPAGGQPESPPEAPPSVEDLARMFKEEQEQRRNLEKKLGEMGNELGKTREKADYYEMSFQQLQNAAAQGMQNQSMWGQVNNPYTQANPQKQDIDYDTFVENPVAAIDKILEQKLSSMTAAQKEEVARHNFQQGYKNALKERPDLMEGVEKDVSNVVWNAYKQGKISPYDIGNTDNWHTFAYAIKGKQRGFKFEPTAPSPVEPTMTSTPSQTRQQPSSQGNWSPTERAMLEMASRGAGFKIDEKALAESMKKGGK